MANPEHLKILRQGVKVWNEWRKKNPEIIPDISRAYVIKADLRKANFTRGNLSEADLSEANLSETIFIEANLYGASLSRTYLYKANLRDANLNGANLHQADLSDAHLFRANIVGANLSAADLTEAYLAEANLEDSDLYHANLLAANLVESNLTETNLSFANLSGADINDANWNGTFLEETIFINTDLSNAKHLESCEHMGPSTVDHRTLSKSGRLPLKFLRGCGIPDFIIDNINMFYDNPIQFYSCFISYSTKDEEFVKRLYADLQDTGIRCWRAPEEMKGGRKLIHQIDEAIRMHDKLLLVLSEESIKSDWVATEIKKALKREKKESRQMLFPISITPYENIKEWELFDSDTGRDLAEVIRSYFIPDFTEWKQHESYKKAFEKLVKDLKGAKKPETALG